MIFNDSLILIRDSRDGTLTERLGAGRCQQNPGFSPRLAYLGFIFGKVALGQDSFRVLIFPCQFYYAPIVTYKFMCHRRYRLNESVVK